MPPLRWLLAASALLLRAAALISPCGLHDINPFLAAKGLVPLLNQTDQALVGGCPNVFAVRDLAAACARLRADGAAMRLVARDMALLHRHACPQPPKALRDHLKVCTGASDRRLPHTATAAQVRTHVLFCHHHLQCNLVALQKDCDDGRYWLVERLGAVCWAPDAPRGRPPGPALYARAVAACEAAHGRPVNATVAAVMTSVAEFSRTGRVTVPGLEAFRGHLEALAAYERAKDRFIALEQERQALLRPDDDDDDDDDDEGAPRRFAPPETGWYSIV